MKRDLSAVLELYALRELLGDVLPTLSCHRFACTLDDPGDADLQSVNTLAESLTSDACKEWGPDECVTKLEDLRVLLCPDESRKTLVALLNIFKYLGKEKIAKVWEFVHQRMRLTIELEHEFPPPLNAQSSIP